MLPGIGLFGTGDIVKALVPFLRSKGFRVEAIWGRTLDAAETISIELNIPFYTNKIDDVLLRKDVDLVFVLCQPELHAQISVKALGIGKHVLCDRPAGLCQSEVLKMVHAAQYYPSLISVISHGLRFLPAFTEMKKRVEMGYVGSVNLLDLRVNCGPLVGSLFDWTCSALMGGGILTTVGSHLIDVVAFVTGQRAVRVNGFLRTFTRNTDKIGGIRWIDSDDFCTFQMILNGVGGSNNATEISTSSGRGPCVTATLNSHLPGPFSQEVIICGSEGRLTVRGTDLYGARKADAVEMLLLKGDPTVGAISPCLLPPPYLQGLFRLVGALQEAFNNSFPPGEVGGTGGGWLKEAVGGAATFEDGQYVQAVIDAIKLSSSSRQWEQVIVSSAEIDTQGGPACLFDPSALASLDALSQAPTCASAPTNHPRLPPHRKVAVTGPSFESHHMPWNFSKH